MNLREMNEQSLSLQGVHNLQPVSSASAAGQWPRMEAAPETADPWIKRSTDEGRGATTGQTQGQARQKSPMPTITCGACENARPGRALFVEAVLQRSWMVRWGSGLGSSQGWANEALLGDQPEVDQQDQLHGHHRPQGLCLPVDEEGGEADHQNNQLKQVTKSHGERLKRQR